MQSHEPSAAEQSSSALFIQQIKQKMNQDHFAMLAGIEIVDAKPGYAKTKLQVEAKHLNAAGVVQGGAIFTLADFAFAIATNYHDRVALATDCTLSFFHPGQAGSTLWAETEQISDSRSLTAYQVQVTDESGKRVAMFYGRAFKVR